jgi:hypothetical protein
MKFEFKHIAVIILALIFLGKRLFAKHPFIQKYNHYISAILIVSLALLISIEFWKTNQLIGIVAVALGLIAMVIVFFDLKSKP